MSVTRLRRGRLEWQQEPSVSTCQVSGSSSHISTYSLARIFLISLGGTEPKPGNSPRATGAPGGVEAGDDTTDGHTGPAEEPGVVSVPAEGMVKRGSEAAEPARRQRRSAPADGKQGATCPSVCSCGQRPVPAWDPPGVPRGNGSPVPAQGAWPAPKAWALGGKHSPMEAEDDVAEGPALLPSSGVEGEATQAAIRRSIKTSCSGVKWATSSVSPAAEVPDGPESVDIVRENSRETPAASVDRLTAMHWLDHVVAYIPTHARARRLDHVVASYPRMPAHAALTTWSFLTYACPRTPPPVAGSLTSVNP